MPNNWKTYKLSEITNLITKGTTPSTYGFGFTEDGINFIKSESTNYDGRLDESSFVKVSEEAHNKLKRSQLEEDDILFSMAGAYLGKTGIVYKKHLPANTNQANSIIRVNKNKALPKFVSFLLRNPSLISYVNASAGQSAQPNINLADIGSLEFKLPPLQEQQSIASILSDIDDKIENNLAINKTLEEMAMALYKHWFVDFGPFQDGEFVESELGMIPKNWEVKSVYSIAKFINGAAFKSKDFVEDAKNGLPIIKIAEIKQGITSQTMYSNKELDPKHTIFNNDILFPWSGNPHTSLGIHLWDKGKALLNQHIFLVRVENPVNRCFVFNTLKNLLPTFINLATHKQTTGLGHVTIANLKDLMILYPNEEIIRSYNLKASPILDLIYSNQMENIALIKLRDTLLPQLITGTVRLKEFGEPVEEVV